jgi:hypothetical protein
VDLADLFACRPVEENAFHTRTSGRVDGLTWSKSWFKKEEVVEQGEKG